MQIRTKNIWKTTGLFAFFSISSVFLYLQPLEIFGPIPPGIVQVVRALFLFYALVLLCEKFIHMEIYNKIFLCLLLGVIAGLVFKADIAEIKPVGSAFIRLIKMIIIPLVFTSLTVGTASLGDPKKLGRIGAKALIYYVVYTAFAIVIGLILANSLQPGSGLSSEAQSQLMQNFSSDAAQVSNLSKSRNVIEILLNIIPTNIFEGLTNGILLQIIFFAIFTGITLALISKEKSKPVIGFFGGIMDAMIQIVHIVIKLAPYATFALIAAVVGSLGTEILVAVFKYALITIAGLIILNFTYPVVVKLYTGMSMMTFMKGIRAPQLIAFSTSSSSAALPVTMEVCEKKLGVSKNITSFVIPLGSTINMNGTALYHAVSAVFIAQVYGLPLTIGDQLMIVLMATLAAIGGSGTPMSGIVMLVMVLEQVGIPTEGIALLLGVERILDMFRTSQNVTGDVSAAVVIAASEGENFKNVK